MQYKKVTNNFAFYEFRPSGSPKSWMPTSKYQKKMIVSLAKNLQIVRDKISKGYMKITNGVRVEEDYNRLIKNGYKPSKTSDHYFGLAIPLTLNSYKYKKYGPTYNFTMGAVDIVPYGITVLNLFSIAINLCENDECDFGQIIYEKNPKTKAEWIHFGGSPKPFLSEEIINFLNRNKYLQSLDGGKTYKTFNLA